MSDTPIIPEEKNLLTPTPVKDPTPKVGYDVEIEGKKLNLVSVDWEGVKVFIEAGDKEKAISKRQEKQALLKSLTEKQAQFETEIKSSKQKVQETEVEKEAIKNSASQEVSAKIDKLYNRLVTQELKTVLLGNQEFIGGEDAMGDAVQLLMANNKFKIDDATGNVISSDDKPVKEIVEKFIGSKAIFKKAPVAAFKEGQQIGGPAQVKKPEGPKISTQQALADALTKSGGLIPTGN